MLILFLLNPILEMCQLYTVLFNRSSVPSVLVKSLGSALSQ